MQFDFIILRIVISGIKTLLLILNGGLSTCRFCSVSSGDKKIILNDRVFEVRLSCLTFYARYSVITITVYNLQRPVFFVFVV